MKRNNPLNIRHNPKNDWLGQTDNQNGFCVFLSKYYGMRAAIILLRNYINQGHETIREIITRWAPPSENPTERYIEFCVNRFVAFGLNVNENTIFNFNFYPWNRVKLAILLEAMSKFENGSDVDVPLFDDWFEMFREKKIMDLFKNE